MDIIFQSGDFYNDTSSFWQYLISIISALFGALISGLIAIYIFNKGLKKERLKERSGHISEYKDLEKYFFHNIASINFFINKQIDEVSKCSQNTKNWNSKNFSLSVLSELTSVDIWKINQEKIYKIFVTNRVGDATQKANDFINVKNCLRNIDNFILEQYELNKEIQNRIVLEIEIWNQSLKSLLDLSNQFVIDYNSNFSKGKDDFLELYTEVIVKKQRELMKENKYENLNIVFTEIIEPLKTYVAENKQSYDKRIYMISEPMINIQRAYIAISNLRYERRKSVLNSGRRLLKIRELLNESIISTKNRDWVYK